MATKIAGRMAIRMELPKLQRRRLPSSGAGRPCCPVGANCRWRSSSAAVLLIALSSLLLFPLGCANPENVTHVAAAQTIQVSSELAPDQVINRQLETDPRTLDPSLSQDVVGFIVLQDLFEGLTTVSSDGSTIPGVATSWETSADGKIWTFHLRKEARWSNGEPVTADDFVYAWRREVDPATASEYSQALAPIQNAMEIADGKMPVDKLGVESMGPQILVVHLHAPTAYLPALLTNAYLFPLYAPAVKQWGDAWTQPGHMVSNGAYLCCPSGFINGHIALQQESRTTGTLKHVRLTQSELLQVVDQTPPAAMDQYLAGDLDSDRYGKPASDKDRSSSGCLAAKSCSGSEFRRRRCSAYQSCRNSSVHRDNPKLRRGAQYRRWTATSLSKYVRRGLWNPPAYNVMPPLIGLRSRRFPIGPG
jgi:hypothetical protein